jgi:hypothetical protein
MKMDLAADPVAIAALGGDGIVLEAHDFTHLVEQLELGIRDHCLPAPSWAVGEFGVGSLTKLNRRSPGFAGEAPGV